MASWTSGAARFARQTEDETGSGLWRRPSTLNRGGTAGKSFGVIRAEERKRLRQVGPLMTMIAGIHGPGKKGSGPGVVPMVGDAWAPLISWFVGFPP